MAVALKIDILWDLLYTFLAIGLFYLEDRGST
jgi:hypothetical protein